jgi:hypothetical protein
MNQLFLWESQSQRHESSLLSYGTDKENLMFEHLIITVRETVQTYSFWWYCKKRPFKQNENRNPLHFSSKEWKRTLVVPQSSFSFFSFVLLQLRIAKFSSLYCRSCFQFYFGNKRIAKREGTEKGNQEIVKSLHSIFDNEFHESFKWQEGENLILLFYSRTVHTLVWLCCLDSFSFLLAFSFSSFSKAQSSRVNIKEKTSKLNSNCKSWKRDENPNHLEISVDLDLQSKRQAGNLWKKLKRVESAKGFKSVTKIDWCQQNESHEGLSRVCVVQRLLIPFLCISLNQLWRKAVSMSGVILNPDRDLTLIYCVKDTNLISLSPS